jgi:hypothetical protein
MSAVFGSQKPGKLGKPEGEPAPNQSVAGNQPMNGPRNPIFAEDIAVKEYQVTYVKLAGSIMDQSIYDRVAATLSELGLPAPANFIQTLLMQDRQFVGWKFRYDGGYAMLLASGNTMEFYDEQGQLLKTVALDAGREAAA